jgi:hypothetical protein
MLFARRKGFCKSHEFPWIHSTPAEAPKYHHAGHRRRTTVNHQKKGNFIVTAGPLPHRCHTAAALLPGHGLTPTQSIDRYWRLAFLKLPIPSK